MSILISLRSCNSAQVSHKGCSATRFCMGLEKQSKLLVSPELWRKKTRCLCNYFPLLPHHYLRDTAPVLLLSPSFRRVHQQPRFDIHTEIEMRKDALLMQAGLSVSSCPFSPPSAFHLSLFSFFFCCAQATFPEVSHILKHLFIAQSIITSCQVSLVNKGN